MKLILGSQSIGRRNVLQKAGYKFKVMTADIDEKAIRSTDYEQLPLILARAKSDALLSKIHEPAILITSDQVVVCNGELREKPESKEEAYRYLKSYGQYPAQTNTAVVVVNTKTGKKAEAISIAKVYFKPMPENIIQQLLEQGKVLNTAGGFMAEDPIISQYIDYIDGTLDGVTGLPLKITEELIIEVSP